MNEKVLKNNPQQISSQNSDIDETLWEMESKLKVLKHCLLQGTDELDENVLRGMSYIVNDLETGVAKAITCFQLADMLPCSNKATTSA